MGSAELSEWIAIFGIEYDEHEEHMQRARMESQVASRMPSR